MKSFYHVVGHTFITYTLLMTIPNMSHLSRTKNGTTESLILAKVEAKDKLDRLLINTLERILIIIM